MGQTHIVKVQFAVMLVSLMLPLMQARSRSQAPVALAPADGSNLLSRTAQRLHDQKPLCIVAFGDSISEVGRSPNWYGGASKSENNWAQQWGSMLRSDYPKSKITVINSGIGGQNSYEGLGRIDDLAPLKPDLVLVEFGTNDCVFHFLEPEQTQLALTTLVREIKRRFGADIVVVGSAGDNPLEPFFRHRDETIAATKAAATDAGVLFVDMRAPILKATENGQNWSAYHLSSANCHPNDAGHGVWARALDAALSVYLKP